MVLVSTLGCGIKKMEDIEAGDFDPDTVGRLGEEVCGSGRKLIPNGGMERLGFDRIVRIGDVVGFAGTSGCYINGDIEDRWVTNGQNLWFNMDVKGSCVEGRSLWKVIRTMGNGANGIYYAMERMDRTESRTVEMGADRAVQGSYASKRVQFRAFKCE